MQRIMLIDASVWQVYLQYVVCCHQQTTTHLIVRNQSY